MLCEDIVRLIGIGVDELQIESLKVLPGTQMSRMAKGKGLKHSPLPPYEILRTPSVSPSELKKAMQVSRMVDLYYNSSVWQDITRELVLSDPAFLVRFTEFLADSMILDSPVSLDRRGVILYEYCCSQYPEKVTDVSLAWIKGGFSLKKGPAGNIIKVKDPSRYLPDGEFDPLYRYFLFTSPQRNYLFGYDSQVHQGPPSICLCLSSPE
jgi:hypothetical protein